MAEFPALPLWTDAYLGDTTHLTTIEHGAYLLLLMVAWRTPGARLPDDDEKLARYARMTRGQWSRIAPTIREFFRAEDGSLFQSRLTDEAVRVRQVREAQATAGRASALKRKGRHSTERDAERERSAAVSANQSSTPTPTPTPTVDDMLSSTSSTRQLAEERREEVDPFDVIATTNDLARRAGVPHTSPGETIGNTDVVRQWHADGIDLPTIEAEIDKFRLDQPAKRIGSLRFFDQGIRAVIAGREAKARKSKPHRAGITGPEAAPLESRDADDDRVRAIRAKLNGKVEHGADRIALSIEGDRLIITARSRFAGDRVDRDLFARLFGSREIEVRIQ